MAGALPQNYKYFPAWNNKMTKNAFAQDRGIGSWSGNEPQDPVDPVTNTEVGPPLPIWGPNSSEAEHFNMNRVLLANIQRNDFFKSLSSIRTVNELIDQIYYLAQNTGVNAHKGADAVPWVAGTHSNKSAGGMCSQVRGVATAGRPTNTWMYLVKLMTLRPTHRQIKKMLSHVDSPYIRIVAAFFVRYTQPPKEVFGWLEDLLHDTEPIKKQKLDKHDTTVGAIVAQILTTHSYEDTFLPRLPAKILKETKALVEEIGVNIAATAQRSGAYRSGGGRSGRGGGGRDRGQRRSRSKSPEKSSGDAASRTEETSTNSRERRRSRSRSRRRDRQRSSRDRDRDRPSGSSGGDRDRDRGRDRNHGRERDRDRDRGRGRSRSRDRDRGRDRDRDRNRDRGGSGRSRRSRSRNRRDSTRDRDRDRDRDRTRRSRSGSRSTRRT